MVVDVVTGIVAKKTPKADAICGIPMTGLAIAYPVAFGLWKRALTLKRPLVDVINDLDRDGLTRELARRYRIAPIEATLSLN